MKQPGLLLLYGIVLMSIFCSAAATSVPDNENCEEGLSFTKISRNDITISWNKACFNNENNYKVELIVNDQYNYNNDDVKCEGKSLCETSIQQMGFAAFVDPCNNVTITVIGKTDTSVNISSSTNLAPWIKTNEWHLEKSNINGSSPYACWGPPDDTTKDEVVSCATKVQVVATCSDADGKNLEIISNPPTLETPGQGCADLEIDKCIDGKEVTLMVTYMSVSGVAGDVPTVTKRSITLDYAKGTDTTIAPPTTLGGTNVYPQCVLVSSGIAMILGILHFNL